MEQQLSDISIHSDFCLPYSIFRLLTPEFWILNSFLEFLSFERRVKFEFRQLPLFVDFAIS